MNKFVVFTLVMMNIPVAYSHSIHNTTAPYADILHKLIHDEGIVFYGALILFLLSICLCKRSAKLLEFHSCAETNRKAN